MMKYRSKWVAAILSILSPWGVAQVYNGQPMKALLFFAVQLTVVLVLVFTGVGASFNGYIVLVFAALVILGVSFVDALKNAGRDIQLQWYNRWYLYALYYAVVLIAVNNAKFGMEAFRMPAASMLPTIMRGDRFIVDNRLTARTEFDRGDIIVFLYPVDKAKMFVMRLVGLPGDRVRTAGTELYINGEKMQHSIIKVEDDVTIMSEELNHHRYTVQYMPYRSFPDQEYVVPEGQLFVMGDNRDNSADSRDWGFLPMDDVLGKTAYIYWSSDRSRIGQPLATHQ